MTHILKPSTFIASSFIVEHRRSLSSPFSFSFHFWLLHAKLHSYRRTHTRTHTHKVCEGIGNQMHVPTSESKLREGSHSTKFFFFVVEGFNIFFCYNHFVIIFCVVCSRSISWLSSFNSTRFNTCNARALLLLSIIILYLQTQIFEIPVRELCMLNGINITFWNREPNTFYESFCCRTNKRLAPARNSRCNDDRHRVVDIKLLCRVVWDKGKVEIEKKHTQL